jgi:hypothetical protein
MGRKGRTATIGFFLQKLLDTLDLSPYDRDGAYIRGGKSVGKEREEREITHLRRQAIGGKAKRFGRSDPTRSPA